MPRKVFDSHLEEMHTDLLRMGSMVEKQIFQCIEALVNQNEKLAQGVIDNDDLIDDMQKEIENKAIKLIAMQQPLAMDLRNIFTTTKIVTDLERIADHAVDIAKVTKRLKTDDYVNQLTDITRMATLVKEMLKVSLDAYVQGDVKRAYAICKKDDEIDALYKQIFSEFLVMMMDNPKAINQATQFLFACKYLERIADHTTNICEGTIYLVTGEQIDLNE
ncbi:phosphate signaling complex protein PhoU [Clostridium pasteurianum]|uniref:Phosphate-specific transport system accessory protein PhoU n=1 Tax=Clostridium pasteurianum BC1 TaxID=86416 RepID=R4KCF4_CLOPA|nr:phosphate signaling complex protein PhoU [Clostridium pasteurianum]AGK97300.1 phosphate transport system regulatory protein PhoU [Clostridium pasteurianum BC1]